VAVNTNEPWVWLVRATVESLLGHGEDAWHCALRARTLSPLDPLKHYFDSLAASAAVAAKRYGEAETLARLSLSKDARHLPPLRALAIAQVHLGRLAEARTTVSNLLQVRPDFTLTRYLASAPRGSEAIRREWASALREAGVPEN
jgi:Flp pilus assembly protein TadD